MRISTVCWLDSSRDIQRNGTPAYGSSLFWCFEEQNTDFYCDSYQSWIRLCPSYLHHLWLVFMMLAILTGVGWNLYRVFICISLTWGCWIYVMNLLVICTSFKNCLLNSPFIYWIICYFVVWSFNSLYFLNINTLPDE
jgi:hypothetical protein